MRTGSKTLLAAIALLLPWGALAETPANPVEKPALFKTAIIGDIEFSTLLDFSSSMSMDIFRGPLSEQKLRALLPDGSDPASINAFLIRGKDEAISIAMPIQGQQKTISGKNILIDAGLGTVRDGRNHILTALQEKGVKPADIDVVLLTHTHLDHVGGLIQKGEALFPNAQILISTPEHVWSQSLIADGKSREMADLQKAYKDRIHQFTFNPSEFPPATDRAPQVFAWNAAGHTPGHTVFLLRSGDAALMVIGDLLHGTSVQFAFPEEGTTYDVDPEQAVVSRRAILKIVADEEIPIAGSHIPFPGVGVVKNIEDNDGMVEKTTEHFSFTPGLPQASDAPNQ